MIVCHCAVVSDRDVTAAIEDGARSVASICRATSAARDCGGCIFTVKALLREHCLVHPVKPMEVARAAG